VTIGQRVRLTNTEFNPALRGAVGTVKAADEWTSPLGTYYTVILDEPHESLLYVVDDPRQVRAHEFEMERV